VYTKEDLENKKFEVEAMSEKSLIQLLTEADKAYYNSSSGQTIMDDDVYDELKEFAQKKFPNNPYFNMVGAMVEKSQKVKHKYVLGSLKKFKPDNINSFLSKFPKDQLYVIMPKLDGAALFVSYENGELSLATSRGDGLEGFDLTHKAKHFLPKKISKKELVELRGEALLTRSVASSLGFANARNGVSGILNRDGVENCEYIRVFFHEYINSPNKLLTEDFSDIADMGLTPVDYQMGSEFGVDELKTILMEMKQDYGYDLDGLVIAPIDYKRENVERPEKKVAFKVNAEGVEAEIDYIEWNVSRTGRVVPLAIFKEPIPIDGSNVSKATCHNFDYVFNNKVGSGAKVKIVKSGDIIPYILSVDKPANGPSWVIDCPSCGEQLVKEGVDLICKNSFGCPEQFIGFSEYFFKTLGAENISAQTFRNLMVTSLHEIFLLNEHTIASMDGFGEKKASQIVFEIKKAITNVEPEILLAACAIPNMGKRNSVKFINSLDKSLTSKEKFEKIFNLDEKLFTNTDGFGISILTSVKENLDRVRDLYILLKEFGLTFNEKESLSEESKDFVKVTVTGKGPHPRKVLEEMFIKKGFEIIEFSSSTEILICDDLESSSSKMKKAKKSGIKITTYEEFINEYM
jgi:DNA ligase (NAD+)